jgi:phage shock protein A
MNMFKRLISSIQGQFDSIVSKIENHDAIVEAAIREVETAAAKARVSLKRVQRDSTDMQNRSCQIEKDIEQWKHRAKELADNDEAKALECIRRAKHAQRELKIAHEQLSAQQLLEAQLNSDILKIQDKLRDLKVQRNILKTREHRAQALHTIGYDESSRLLELRDIIDRWEAKITAHEIGADISCGSQDSFVDEFVSNEEEKQLKVMLQELLNK